MTHLEHRRLNTSHLDESDGIPSARAKLEENAGSAVDWNVPAASRDLAKPTN